MAVTGFDVGSDFVKLKSFDGIFVDSLAKSYRCFFESSNMEPAAVLVYGDDVEDVDAVAVVVVAADVASITFGMVAVSADVCLFLSNGLIRSDGFNVFDWNWL